MSEKRENSSSSVSARPLKKARAIKLDPHKVILDCVRHYFQDLSHAKKYEHLLNFHGIRRSLMRSMEFDGDWVGVPDTEDGSTPLVTVKCRPSFTPYFELDFPQKIDRLHARFIFGIPSAAASPNENHYIPVDQTDQYRDAFSLTRALLNRVAESIKGLVHDRSSFKKAVSYQILQNGLFSIKDSSDRSLFFRFAVRGDNIRLFSFASGRTPAPAFLVLSEVAERNVYKIVAAYSETYKYPPNMRLAFRSCNPHLDLVLEEDIIYYE